MGCGLFAQDPVDATIDTSDILYWVGTGNNKLTFVVNWSDTALAWGYRFNTESVSMSTVINDLAAADPRLTFGATGMLDDIWFMGALLEWHHVRRNGHNDA